MSRTKETSWPYYVRRGLLTEADAQDMLTWRGTGGFSLALIHG